MAFWIVAALLTLAAALAVLRPLGASRAPRHGGSAHELEVYRDQLAEVERDVGRGALSPGEADEARAEIARRILRLPGADGPSERAAPRWVVAAGVMAIPLASWGLYGALGSPGIASQPLQARLTADPAQSSVEELVARAERHLAANPDDVRGWDVLAPIYARIGRAPDGVAAYRNAIRIGGGTAEREAGLGEAIAVANGGLVTAEAMQAFDRALSLDPANPRARFYRATGIAQDGRTEEAVSLWRAMIADLAPDSAWAMAAGQAITEARAAASGPGPSQEDVAAAGEMDAGERAAMVEGMVARLDERLRDDGSDRDGWKRLLRSYMILGRRDDAQDALARAVEALGATSEAALDVLAFARSIGLVHTE